MRLRLSLALAAGVAAMTAVPAAGQPAEIAPGAIVTDTKGGAVGTVVRVDGAHLIVRTDRHEARLPASSFRPAKEGLLFGMTQAELNAAVERTKAQIQARIAPGAAVADAGGAAVGTVEAVDEASVTVKLASGVSVRLPRNAVAATETGVRISLTAAQLSAAAERNKPLGGG
jgi:preprotein translocase subunit YajC